MMFTLQKIYNHNKSFRFARPFSDEVVFFAPEIRPALKADRGTYYSDWDQFDKSFGGQRTPLALLLVDDYKYSETIDNLICSHLNAIEVLAQQRTSKELAELAKTARVPMVSLVDHSWPYFDELVEMSRHYLAKRREIGILQEVTAQHSEAPRERHSEAPVDPQLEQINARRQDLLYHNAPNQGTVVRQMDMRSEDQIEKEALTTPIQPAPYRDLYVEQTNARIKAEVEYANKHKNALNSDAQPHRLTEYDKREAPVVVTTPMCETDFPNRVLVQNSDGELDFAR